MNRINKQVYSLTNWLSAHSIHVLDCLEVVPGGGPHISDGSSNTFERAPIATSGDNNVYVSWWSNKTGVDKIMFKASTDGGKTWSNKMIISNAPNVNSQDVQIVASGSNVYVS